MSEHDQETQAVPSSTEDAAEVTQETAAGGPSPAGGPDTTSAAPVDAPAAEVDDDQDDDAPAPHAASRGYGVTGKFSTTNRNDA